MTGCFILDYDTKNAKRTNRRETHQILQEMFEEITKNNNRLVYSHKVKWMSCHILSEVFSKLLLAEQNKRMRERRLGKWGHERCVYLCMYFNASIICRSLCTGNIHTCQKCRISIHLLMQKVLFHSI